MKIAIVTWRDIKHPKAGGSELYFHELAKRWVKWGNEVVWLSPKFENCLSEETCDGIRIIRKRGMLSLGFQAGKLKDVDIIIDVENGVPFFTPLFSKKKKILQIHHIHKDVWFRELSFPLAVIGWIIETKIMPIVYRKVRVMTISKSSAEEITREKFTKFQPYIVNPGIEFYKTKKFAKSKEPTILFLNRIKKYKGVKILLDAVKEINKEKNDIKVLIAGSGDDLESMKKYAQKNKLNNVKFLGRISEKKKAELMQKAWIFVNPSFKEGWGIVNIEANYFGTPVLGSDVGGIRDSVVDKKTGLIFPYGDHKALASKIKYLIKNKKILANMSKNGKKWAKNFSWDKKAKEYLNILKKTF
jgi:glycosyltransferase involved in cell wall biosynthesis